MLFNASVILASVVFTIGAFAQDGLPKPEVSKDPMTEEQVAVYRAVLRNYMAGSQGALNISNRTDPLELAGPFFDKECVRGIALETAYKSSPVVHQLSPAVTTDARMVLVDPERQRATVKENDPQNLIQKAVNDHEKVTNKQLDKSVKQAFSTGLFTFSEIVFDKTHRRAVVSYTFMCGMLCGHGNTLIVQKVGDKWKVIKTCGGWVS